MKEVWAIFDLDGTILRVNSLKKFLIWEIKKLLLFHNYKAVGIILASVALRQLRMISHERMKWLMMSHCHNLENVMTQFCDTLMNEINWEVVKLMEKERMDGYKIAIVTSAPEEYALPFSQKLRADICLATKRAGNSFSDYRQNKGVAKVERVKPLCSDIRCVVTDHYDDIPLMRICQGKNYLVNPSKHTICRLKKNGIGYLLLQD